MAEAIALHAAGQRPPITVLQLIEAGQLQPGGIISVTFRNNTTKGILQRDGSIQHNGRIYASCGEFSSAAKQRIDPAWPADDGWKSCMHNGKSLHAIRSAFGEAPTLTYAAAAAAAAAAAGIGPASTVPVAAAAPIATAAPGTGPAPAVPVAAAAPFAAAAPVAAAASAVARVAPAGYAATLAAPAAPAVPVAAAAAPVPIPVAAAGPAAAATPVAAADQPGNSTAP